MKTVILGMPLAIAASLTAAQPAGAQISIGVGRPGVSVNTPYFSFQYGRAYPYYYGYRPYSFYDVPFYGNSYGLYRTYPPITYDRYGLRYAPGQPSDYYGMFPRRQPVPTADAESNNSANVRVIVPKSDALVWFDDTLMRQIGTDRQYVTPPLEKDKTAAYRIRASWTENGRKVNREKNISVTPGQEAVVDFNDEPIP